MTASIPTATETTLSRSLLQWKPATWEEYLACRDAPTTDRMRIFFHRERLLLIDMTSEGINHACFSDLFAMLFFIWANQRPDKIYSSFGRCLLEKPTKRAGAPDLVLYVGEGYPRWQKGEPRRIDLNQWRVPNLVGEISDTTLAIDLDEKKQLYAEMEIPEYWVIDVTGKRVFAFQLQSNGRYQECAMSLALEGLPVALLEQTLERLSEGTNTSAAAWFAQQIANFKAE